MTTLFQSLFVLSLTMGDRINDRMAAVRSDEKGASAVEYALLVGAIALAVVAAVAVFGTKLKALFNGINLSPSAT